MKILIVDGSRQRRHEMVETLGELTNVVIQGAVADVRSALRAVVDTAPDVVVTGPVLPDGDGTQLIERLRRLRHTPSVVVVTPSASEAQRDRYVAAGASHYVDNHADLVSTVASLAQSQTSIPTLHTLELLGRMTASVVHDLNNYVGILEVMLALLRRDPADAALWSQAHEALDAIQRLDATLLEYARGGTPERGPVDLGEVTRHIVQLAGRLVPANVQVDVDIIATDAQPIDAVRSDIEQLVLNLVVNACDAMPAGGELVVSVRRIASAMLLEVADTGHGDVPLPADGRAPSTKPHGSGLGLGIVHAALDRYGGAIRVIPRTGGGTLVAVMLPFASASPLTS